MLETGSADGGAGEKGDKPVPDGAWKRGGGVGGSGERPESPGILKAGGAWGGEALNGERPVLGAEGVGMGEGGWVGTSVGRGARGGAGWWWWDLQQDVHTGEWERELAMRERCRWENCVGGRWERQDRHWKVVEIHLSEIRSRWGLGQGSGGGGDEMALAITWEVWRKVVKSCSRLGKAGSWVTGATDASAADANWGGGGARGEGNRRTTSDSVEAGGGREAKVRAS